MARVFGVRSEDRGGTRVVGGEEKYSFTVSICSICLLYFPVGFLHVPRKSCNFLRTSCKFLLISYMFVRSNFNTREFNSRENYRFFGHNSAPCGNFWTILRHKLPIIHPDLPIPSNNLNSSVQPEFLNPIFLYKPEKSSRVLTAERISSCCFPDLFVLRRYQGRMIPTF